MMTSRLVGQYWSVTESQVLFQTRRADIIKLDVTYDFCFTLHGNIKFSQHITEYTTSCEWSSSPIKIPPGEWQAGVVIHSWYSGSCTTAGKRLEDKEFGHSLLFSPESFTRASAWHQGYPWILMDHFQYWSSQTYPSWSQIQYPCESWYSVKDVIHNDGQLTKSNIIKIPNVEERFQQ